MSYQSHRDWQRATLLNKVAKLRDEYLVSGRPYNNTKLAETCCSYVGVDSKQALKWINGER